MRPARHTCHAAVVVTGNPGHRPAPLASGETVAGYLWVALGEEAPVRLYLHPDWAELLDYCWPGARLGLRHVRCHVKAAGDDDPVVSLLATETSYVVLEPSVLVNPSVIRQMAGCPRKYYTHKRQGDSDRSAALIRGSVVNDIFDRLLEDAAADPDAVREQALAGCTLDLACLADSQIPLPAMFRAEVTQHLEPLADWIRTEPALVGQELTLEPTLISPKYGLAGRLDLLVAPGPDATTFELKTGRPWPEDELQVAAYQLLLESAFSCRNPSSYLLYSLNGVGKVARAFSVEHRRRREVIRIRNRMVAFDYALTLDAGALAASPVAAAVPRVEAGDCANCKWFIKNPCLRTCRVLQEKACATCSQRLSCAGTEDKPAAELDYYHRYFRLIEVERAQSRANYARNWLDPLGLAGEGKAIAGLIYGGGEGYEVKFRFSRPNESQFRPGDLVLLHPGDMTRAEVYKATVADIDRVGVTLALKKSLPAERWQGRRWAIGGDSMETSFNSMQAALYNWLSRASRHQRSLILGHTPPRFSAEVATGLEALPLNPTQRHAIARALQAEDYLLIQGPPGTGKTHTLAHLIAQLTGRGDRVLLCAFTHRAVDNVLGKLVWDIGYDNFVRLGSHGAVEPALRPWLLQEKYKAERLDDLPRLQAQLKAIQVVACTSIAAVTHPLVQKLAFDTVVVDEASQLTEPGTLAAVCRGRRFVLVGDHRQLPSVVQSEPARREGLARSLFERLIDLNRGEEGVLVTLKEQYRMHRDIMAFSNEQFYAGKLLAHPDNADALLPLDLGLLPLPLRPWLDPDQPLVFLDVPDVAAEADLCELLVDGLIGAGIAPADIGLITPFRAQVAEITRRVRARHATDALMVDTVDRFQGNDREVILFSCAVSELGLLDEFVGEARRLNVTLTRAKKKLVIIGNGELLRRHPLFADLLRRATTYEAAAAVSAPAL